MNDSIEYKGHIITISQDETPDNPRGWDNIGIILAWHKRYDLGDSDSKDLDYRDYDGWDEMETAIKRRYNPLILLPLVLYDHGGISISIGTSNPFDSMGWDSGRVGYIMATRERCKVMGTKYKGPANMAKLRSYLEGEIKTYNSYLSGDVYGYSVDGPHCDDSCWGFYGDDAEKEAKSMIDYAVKRAEREHLAKVKSYIKSGVPLQYRFV